MKNNKLDQFYTNPKITDEIVNKLAGFFDLENYNFIEPAAGTGNFIDSLHKIGIEVESKCLAFDIEPKNNKIIQKQDFLKLNITKMKKNKSSNIVITNPPFGQRGKLALEFLNKSLEFADIVCMILPNTFNRYSIQSKILPSAKLIYSEVLPPNSFLVNDREYSVKCVLQIWTNENVVTWFSDQRLKKSDLTIDDLDLFIHNNTQETLKYFNKKKYKWNFAVVRQGYYNYKEKITSPDKLVKNRQYLFIKTKNKYLLSLIKNIDFSKLALSNTTTLG